MGGDLPASLSRRVARNVFILDSLPWSGCLANQDLSQALASQKEKPAVRAGVKNLPHWQLTEAQHRTKEVGYTFKVCVGEITYSLISQNMSLLLSSWIWGSDLKDVLQMFNKWRPIKCGFAWHWIFVISLRKTVLWLGSSLENPLGFLYTHWDFSVFISKCAACGGAHEQC